MIAERTIRFPAKAGCLGDRLYPPPIAWRDPGGTGRCSFSGPFTLPAVALEGPARTERYVRRVSASSNHPLTNPCHPFDRVRKPIKDGRVVPRNDQIDARCDSPHSVVSDRIGGWVKGEGWRESEAEGSVCYKIV